MIEAVSIYLGSCDGRNVALQRGGATPTVYLHVTEITLLKLRNEIVAVLRSAKFTRTQNGDTGRLYSSTQLLL